MGVCMVRVVAVVGLLLLIGVIGGVALLSFSDIRPEVRLVRAELPDSSLPR